MVRDGEDPIERLLEAVVLGDAVAARVVLDADPALVDRLDDADLATLVAAAEHGNVAAVELALDIGFPIEARGDDGGAALHAAAYGDTPDSAPTPDWLATVSLLLDAGASLDEITLDPDDAKHPSAAVMELLRSAGSRLHKMKPTDRSDTATSTTESIFYEPGSRDREVLPHDPFKALVAPRPIGWISTLGPDGETNLAPYSFFNAVGTDPPMLAFSSKGMKDSATFAVEQGEFVWNLVTWDLREQMSDTSASLERGDCEFLYSGLEMAPSRLVKAPRVAASPCSMECKVVQASELRDLEGRGVNQYLIIGQVVGIHLDESAIVDGVVDTARLRSIARCGGLTDYAVVDSLFELPRRSAD